ncbi:MAG: polysaccharide biosynthesis/export family protein [Thermoguttaceae bacterium]
MMTRSQRPAAVVLFFLLSAMATTGCTSISSRETVSPYCFPNGLNGGPRSDQEPINLVRLRQDPPAVYMLGPGDTLGIYIEGVLGSRDEPPPVHFPERFQGEMPPAIGYPIPIREDGSLPLPLVPAITADGLTITQLETAIRKAYTEDNKILVPGRDRIIVTLMRPRNYKVLVIREDIQPKDVETREESKGEFALGGTRLGSATVVELRAYENDVLHALGESGGLPGVMAKNELIILRGSFNEAQDLTPLLDDIDSYVNVADSSSRAPDNVIRIPLRARPGEPVQKLKQDDIILGNGDIIFIQSRDAEVFYTGGLLKGGQFPIPRDYDLDVLGAMAMSGGSIAAAAGGSGLEGVGSGVGSIFPPTRVLVLRMVNGRQNAIEIDLKEAMRDPNQRILIEPNDFVVLEYRPNEIVMNTILSTFRINMSLDSLWN